MKTILTTYTVPLINHEIIFGYINTGMGLNLLDNIKKSKETKQFYNENKLGLDPKDFDIVNSDCAYVATDNQDKPLAIIFYREHFDNGVLVHETNHLIYYLSRYYGFSEETEFQAYLQEHIFNDINRLIQNK